MTNWKALNAEDERNALQEREERERREQEQKRWERMEAKEAMRRLEPEPDFPGDER